MLDHLEAGGNVFEHLALVLADPAEHRAAAARTGAGGFVGDGLARQMVRQPGTNRNVLARTSPSDRGLLVIQPVVMPGGIGRGQRVHLPRRLSSSSSPISSSSCSMSRSSFSDDRPNRARRSTASCIFSFSICSVLARISASRRCDLDVLARQFGLQIRSKAAQGIEDLPAAAGLPRTSDRFYRIPLVLSYNQFRHTICRGRLCRF